jgi:uncharacterized protein YcnI
MMKRIKKMLKKLVIGFSAAALIAVPSMASAHVVVTPTNASIGQEVVFSVSVPNEQQVPVVSLKLAIPAGVSSVTPTTKSGWTIETSMTGTGDTQVVTAITWISGQIPAGQRDDFTFSAQVPAHATQLDWKAYQSYADGSVINWDQKPTGSDKSSGTAGPYSVTGVSNDLAQTASKATTTTSPISILALVLASAAFITTVGGILFRKK